MSHIEWILCPVCGSKTRLKIRHDTVLENFPLYCPKCKQVRFEPPFPFALTVSTEA